jgi:S1-C subfamily serine protease
MNIRTPLIAPFLLLVAFLFYTPAMASESDDMDAAEKAELKAQLEAEYEKAFSTAEASRQAAEAAVDRAREQMKASEAARAGAAEASARAKEAQAAEMAKMREDLGRVRRQLREASREVARVDREVARARAEERRATTYTFSITDRPVIGVILGDVENDGVKVLGLSPDGPAERAGVQPGDVIVAMDGRALNSVEESGDPARGLLSAIDDVKPDEPVSMTVERAGKKVDLSVVPEVREPMTWSTITRIPSAPLPPDETVIVERIVVPEVDTEAIAEKVAQIRAEVAERRKLITIGAAPHVDGDFEYEFHDMSELGSHALHDANIWFGLPMTQGLKLAEIEPGLGDYFKTDRGVLVLKAKEDNELQVKPGDVILQVGETNVDSPAEFMRALREFEAGEELEIDIKRERRNRTLKVVMPERRTSFFVPDVEQTHSITITTGVP